MFKQSKEPEKKGSEKREDLLVSFLKDAHFVFAIILAWLPFLVMLLNYFFALPCYVFLNAATGTGATRTVFMFQATTTIAYLFCLWGLGYCNVPLAAYWAVEYLYVMLLGIQSVVYLRVYLK